MTILATSDLERVFRTCFLTSHHTVLVGGGAEPLYLPSDEPERSPHRVVYREDFFASALHEVAHWCLAGAARRKLEDYGYWYSPDGRDAEAQLRFERAEVDPQALESIFSETCGFSFQLSADNLSADAGPSDRFAAAVAERRRRFLEEGLPERAARYRDALSTLLRTRRSPSDRPGRASPEARRLPSAPGSRRA